MVLLDDNSQTIPDSELVPSMAENQEESKMQFIKIILPKV